MCSPIAPQDPPPPPTQAAFVHVTVAGGPEPAAYVRFCLVGATRSKRYQIA